jgi:hypothetical protein
MKKKYDVFVSYASEEREWVQKCLYKRLQRCRTSDGRRPRIFFDISKDGVQMGAQGWMEQLANAIQDSEKFVPVYSPLYFQKKMCVLELQKFFEIDPTNERSMINPVLIKGRGKDLVPFMFDLVQFTEITVPDWFERLSKGLGLTPDAPPVLEFLDQVPKEVIINNTLPALRVRVKDDVPDAEEIEVTITADMGALQGTLTKETKQGVAAFTDLSFSVRAARTRLCAAAEDCESVYTDWFAAKGSLPDPHGTSGPVIEGPGEAVFFASDETVAVINGGAIRLFEISGRPAGRPISLTGRLKLVKRAGGLLAMADWNGQVYIFSDDGEGFSWAPQERPNGLEIPGGLAISDSKIYAGFWSGRVVEIAFPKDNVTEWSYVGGVQAIEAAAGSLYVTGLDGKLATFINGEHTVVGELEPTIHLIKAFPGCLVAVGDRQIYHFEISTGKISRQSLPFPGPCAIIEDVERPVVVDPSGRGVRFDSDLVYRTYFHTAAGAVPTSADNAGKYCVFRNADGSYTLMINDKMVFTCSTGALAVSPSGAFFAVGDASGIRILSAGDLLRLVKESGGE